MLDRRSFLASAAGLLSAARLHAASGPPNILLIVADDLGWADVGYHGARYRTPNIDRLARTGAELNHHYVAPVCTPTRCALLSGRYWSRFGVTGPQNEQAMPFGTVTLASALKSRGYETCISGKWHLGSLPEWGPLKFGFDRSYGALAGGTGPWDHRYKRGPYTRNWHRNDQYIEEQGHVTDLILREALAFLDAPHAKPFFLYLPFTAVHHPLNEPKVWVDANADIDPDRRQYAACVQHMDDAVGKVIAALEKNGLRRNTVVVFTSDNGGQGRAGNDLKSYPGEYEDGLLGENAPLRGKKGQVYEGGIRVPAFVNLPGRVPARRVDAPIHAIDWLPTLTALAGYRPAGGLKWDGRDVWRVVTGQGTAAPRDLYWKGPGGRAYAVRSGEWKLVVEGEGESRRTELFQVGDDPYEQRDRAPSEPARVTRLEQLLAEFRKSDNDAVVPRPAGGKKSKAGQ
ncbi:MAG: sulfatase-like hydrolase/transferase [Bryobacterales bacterium]|nr:sulfatase-like hydrolase/transferase [Bryobacterales bacterium]